MGVYRRALDGGPMVLRFAAMEFLVRTVGVESLARLLGADLEPRSATTTRPLTDRDRRYVKTAQAIGRRWPFGRGPCLRESLVIAWLLRRHHPTLRLGVRRRGTVVTAHAWLEIGADVIGLPGDYRPLQRPAGGAR